MTGVLMLTLVVTLGAVYATQPPTMDVRLVDAVQKAKKQTATVQVTVGALNLVDPDSAQAGVQTGEGHLHYQMDSGPVIATTATKLSFHGLAGGKHSIVITLVGNDHSPLGPQETIAVVIP